MHPAVSIRLCKKRTIRHMARLHLYLPLFLSCIFLLFAFFGVCLLVYAFVPLTLSFVVRAGVSLALSLTVSLFLLAPLWCGVRTLLLHALLYGQRGTLLLFSFFTHKKRYLFALKHSLNSLIRFFFSLGALILDFAFFRRVLAYFLSLERYAAAMLSALLCFFFAFLVLRAFRFWRHDNFLLDAVFLSSPLLSYRQMHTLSVVRMQRGAYLLRRLNFSFLPLWGLSFLLCGLPLVLVLPYYLGARATLAASLLRA